MVLVTLGLFGKKLPRFVDVGAKLPHTLVAFCWWCGVQDLNLVG